MAHARDVNDEEEEEASRLWTESERSFLALRVTRGHVMFTHRPAQPSFQNRAPSFISLPLPLPSSAIEVGDGPRDHSLSTETSR